MTAVWLKLDDERVIQALQEATEKLDSVVDELVLDFSSVRRIDPCVLRKMEEFVVVADGRAVKIVLHGVSTGVYKVLKLLKMASRFSFTS
jgi:anti-anti-sigma regulatory factor